VLQPPGQRTADWPQLPTGHAAHTRDSERSLHVTVSRPEQVTTQLTRNRVSKVVDAGYQERATKQHVVRAQHTGPATEPKHFSATQSQYTATDGRRQAH
jgi:hypothetical protein